MKIPMAMGWKIARLWWPLANPSAVHVIWNMHTPTLSTPRLRMRPFLPDDYADLLQICSDPDAMRHIPPSYLPETPEEVTARLQRYQDHQARFGMGFYHVANPSGDFVGRAGLFWIEEAGLFELGYSLLPQYWGQGLATELTWRIIAHAFEEMGLAEICGRTVPWHTASRHVLEKTGFGYAGLRPFHVAGQVMDFAYYLLRAKAGEEHP